MRWGTRCPRREWGKPREARWVPLEIAKSIATNNATKFINHKVRRLDCLGIVVHMDSAAVSESGPESGTRSHTKKHAKDVLAFLVEMDGDSQIMAVGGEPVATIRRRQNFEILETFLENKAILRPWEGREEKGTEVAHREVDIAALLQPPPGVYNAGLGSIKLGLVIGHMTENNRGGAVSAVSLSV